MNSRFMHPAGILAESLPCAAPVPPLCPTCGGLCWTDHATTACRDCGGTGRLSRTPYHEPYAAPARPDEDAPDD
jgi:hypothetical protein